MITLEPWQTVAPALAALALALGGAAAGGWRALVPRRDEAPVVLGVVALAVAARLLLPPWERHIYDGHEAEYFDIFRGERAVGRGGTLLYPLLQWGWWAAGEVLPRHPAVPVGFATLVGAASCGLVALLGQRVGGRWAGAAVGLLVAVDPSHVAWSVSAYNVVFPAFTGLVCLAAAAPGGGAGPAARAALGLGAAGVTVGLRLDALVLPAVAGVWALLAPPPGGGAPRVLVRLAVVLAGLLLMAAVALPIVFPGGVPGEGERTEMLRLQAAWLAPYGGRDGAWRVSMWAIWSLAAVRAAPRLAVPVAAGLLGHHLLLASFDDVGERHAIPAALLGLLLGAIALGRGSRVAWAGLVVLALLGARGALDLRARFYASEEAFAARLAAPPWGALPRIGLAAARAPGCAWVAEDHRAVASPPLSHFNLLQASEYAALQESFGCVRWCVELEDFRWSSRGVRDRALRTASLYAGAPVAVVEDPASGYACLVMELTARREPLVGRTGTDLPLP